jgi:glycosyltransferase involved in cell wall biosynthesis
MQDDINWEQLAPDFSDYFRAYFATQFRRSDRSYIVSDAAKANLNDNLPEPVPFIAIPNGADYLQIRGISTDEIESYRERHRLRGKFVISYIGGPAKFDPDFAGRLFAHIESAMPEAQFLVVGKIRPMPNRNVTWTGAVPPDVAAVYYNLSDVGTVLRDCGSDPFLSNSVPLKFVQYAAARKPVLSSPIDWVISGNFPNIVCIPSTRVEDWCAELQRIRNEFVWTSAMEKSWESYSWQSVCATLFDDLRALAASQSATIAG